MEDEYLGIISQQCEFGLHGQQDGKVSPLLSSVYNIRCPTHFTSTDRRLCRVQDCPTTQEAASVIR